MSMKMGWRWYGEGNDPITLSDIKQIPGVEEIVWALHSKMPGEIWEEAEIKEVVDQIHAAGFDATVVESVNVHDDIKIGLPTRDKYIENYKQCIRNLSKFGVKTICYNFMPIFDWTRTDLFHPVGDGSTALFYQKDLIQDDYKGMANYILEFTEKYNMTFPGWEPERMAKLDELFKAYAPVTKEKLWDNLKYFLEAIMPTCRECDIKMAIHMDDPPWDIFGLPRLLVDAEEATPRLIGIRQDGEQVDVAGMSEGSRDQLYLALRLAALELQVEQGLNIPLIADDLFINFDDRRTAAGLKVLGELSRKMQVVFLTHHDHLVPLAREVLGADMNVVLL